MCWFQIWHWFSKIWTQIHKCEHFVSKSINFLNLTKFCLCHISNCWFQIWHLFTKISNSNPQIWTFWPKSINFFISSKFYLNAILKVLISNLTCVFCRPWQYSAQVTRINSMSPFCNLFGKHFSFFGKCLNKLWPQFLIFWRWLLKIWQKKSKHI